MSMKNSNDTIGNRTCDIPACSAVTQTTASPRAPIIYRVHVVKNQSHVVETECIDGKWIGTGQTGGTFPWFQTMCHENGVRGQQSSAQWEREEANSCRQNAKRREHTSIRKKTDNGRD
jgi:hypothetical protein